MEAAKNSLQASPADQRRVFPRLHAGPARVLIGEDDPLVALMLEQAVRDFGGECVGPFAKIAAALRAAKTEQFDAALLNVRLSDGECYDLAAALDQRRISFAFITGLPPTAVHSRWMDRPFVSKPFLPEDVTRMLRKILLFSPAAHG